MMSLKTKGGAMNVLENVEIYCPYCGELMEIEVDRSVEKQHYTEDCEICCRPIEISIYINEDREVHVDVRGEYE